MQVDIFYAAKLYYKICLYALKCCYDCVSKHIAVPQILHSAYTQNACIKNRMPKKTRLKYFVPAKE